LNHGTIDIQGKAQAHWLRREIIAWPVEPDGDRIYQLHYAATGGMRVRTEGLQGGQTIPLEYAGAQLSTELAEEFPHLRHSVMLRIPKEYLAQAAEMLKGQLAVSITDQDEALLDATGVQIPGVLDDLYTNDEPLGVIWRDGVPTLRVWAPTAKSVTLHLFPDSKPGSGSRTVPMDWDGETGAWSVSGEAGWAKQFYLYEVEVYVRKAGKVVRNLVTDPYSTSLATNSARSQIVDLGEAGLKPEGWDDLEKPALASPTDIVIYELHVRDFSAWDPSVPEAQRGTYLAFTQRDSNGMQHLKRLAQAGLTHVHLLPVFDFATVNESKAEWVEPDYAKLRGYPPDSEWQQAAVARVRHKDGYNWGYDPYHFTTPEGSYATDPDDPARTRQFRQMVIALNGIGLRVVMDVVYNHTHASGQSDQSVLDRVVPGYYHRLDAYGEVTSSTCCHNTASEHAMMEKLMVDSLLTWVRDYKVDGFRFDLMGHHMVRNMQKVRQALDSLTVEEDGVDGKAIYMYGEGWNFGEVANNARGANATQHNLAGTGIGTFNDRIRDAVRGGNPFGDVREQGFATGLYSDPNQAFDWPLEGQKTRLLELGDVVRVTLAGNLADYRLVNAQGWQVRGAELYFNGAPAGYTQRPEENVVYVSSHDNKTLFDAIQYKAPLGTSMDERVRMQNLALSIVALSQGVPFFHAGSELLRSKSLDRDSFDSGDWFNKLDFTYASNNWGVGLPLKDINGANWPLMKERLSRPELKPDREHILAARDHFESMLRVRKSSALFRLQSAEQVKQRVRFHNTGPGQIPGLIVMSLRDDGPEKLDERYDLIVVVFNAGKANQSVVVEDLPAAYLRLHPVLAESSDRVVRQAAYDPREKRFSVPGRTTAVFVRRR
jgi:pullulanase